MITLLNKFDDNYVIGKINDICDIVSPYIRQYNLGGYLKDISFNPESKYLAYYNIRTNRLFFNDEKIIRTGYRLFDQLRRKYQISEKYYTYFLNYFYLYIIYHELTHVYQKARDESTLNELYLYLYELCDQLRKESVHFYNKFHDLFPMEREAINNGALVAYNLMKYTKLPGYECKVMRLKYFKIITADYELVNQSQVISPIETLLNKYPERLEKINELSKTAKLSKEMKFNFGLPVSTQELKNVNFTKKKILYQINKA